MPENEVVNSQDIQTLTLLLQINQNNNGAKNDFLDNQIRDLITSLKMHLSAIRRKTHSSHPTP